MANSHQHLQQWKHNRRFLEAIDPDFSDWVVTVAFYVALHAVDALLAHDKVAGVVSHETRNSVLIRTNRYQQIQRHYMPLFGLSRTVRYLAEPQKWVAADQIDRDVLKRYLYPIEQSVQKLTGLDLQAPAVRLRG